MTKNKIAPSSIEAENAFLGSIIYQPELIDNLDITIKQEDFFSYKNGIIFKAIMQAHTMGAVDQFTVFNAVEKLTKDIQPTDILKLLESVIDPYHAPVYAHIIKVTKTRRDLLVLADKMRTLAHDESQDTPAILAKLSAELSVLADEKTVADKTILVSKVASTLMDELMSAMVSGGLSGFSTGFPELDRMTNGLEPNRFWVVAGKTGMGKSVFMDTLALNLARQCIPVFYAVSERSKEQVVRRLLAAVSGVSYHEQSQNASPQKVKAITDGLGEIAKLNIMIDHSPMPRISYLQQSAKAFLRGQARGVVLFDGMYRARLDEKVATSHELYGGIAKELKTMAGELDIPVITTHQLNRASGSNRPQLAHLRESGNIEQEADIVMFVHRQGYHDSSVPATETELIIAKNRDGETGTIGAYFDGEHSRILPATITRGDL